MKRIEIGVGGLRQVASAFTRTWERTRSGCSGHGVTGLLGWERNPGMSEQTQADRPQFTPPSRDGSLEPSSRFVPLADGRVARFDPSESPVDPVDSTETPAEFSSVPPQRHGEVLSQASLFVDQLRIQVSELQRRDQILATQFQQLGDLHSQLIDKQAGLAQHFTVPLRGHAAELGRRPR